VLLHIYCYVIYTQNLLKCLSQVKPCMGFPTTIWQLIHSLITQTTVHLRGRRKAFRFLNTKLFRFWDTEMPVLHFNCFSASLGCSNWMFSAERPKR